MNDRLAILNWMDANGAITGCSNLYNKQKLEKFIGWVGEASNVTSLNLSGNDIGRYPDYTYETAEGVFIQPGKIYDISKLTNLLEDNTSITCLDLSHNSLSTSHIEALAIALKTNSTLTELHIGNNKDIGDKGIRKLLTVLSTNKTFNVLTLTANPKITPAIVSALKQNQIHYSLHLCHSKLNKECLKDILMAMKNNTSLPELKLNENINGDMRDVDIYFDENRKSYIQYNQVYKKAETFTSLLANNQTLTSFDFSGNRIGPKGIAAISTALESNTTLKSLGMSIVGADNLERFLQAFNKNTTLTSLNLYGSNIGPNGIKIIANFLTNNKTLTSLSLSSCKTSEEMPKTFLYKTLISDQDIQVLAEALATNSTITSLDLSYNFISSKGVKALMNVIDKHNWTLTSLNISDENSREDIEPLLQRNINAEAKAATATYIDLCLRFSPHSKQIVSIPEINAQIAQQLLLISSETARALTN